MPSIYRDINRYKIPFGSDAKLIKQKLHRIKQKWALKIKEKV